MGSFRPGAGSQHLHWHFNFTGCIAETALKSLRLSCGSELTEHHRKERRVDFYAEQLFLSPKHFSTVVKKVSGKTAGEWIDEYVILEAKALLKYSVMSIQEVAYFMNFPNPSFFGKYFKHHTGLSPSEYKMQ